MIVTTAEKIPGHEATEILGIVRGNTIRARHVGRDVLAGLKSIVGGEISDYTKMIAESREQSLDRMIQAAAELGADARNAIPALADVATADPMGRDRRGLGRQQS